MPSGSTTAIRSGKRNALASSSAGNDAAPTIPEVEFPYTPGEPAPTSNDTAINFVGDQGRAKGAAHFSRCEGQVFEGAGLYVVSQ